MQAQLVGISLSVAPGEAAYIPLRHSYAGAPDQLAVDDVLARLKPWLEDAAQARSSARTSSTTPTSSPMPASRVRGYVHDTMLESYVLEAHKPHGLESLALRHLNRSGLSYEDLCGKGVHQIPFAQVEIDEGGALLGRRQRDVPARAPPPVAADRGRDEACATSTNSSRCRPSACWRASSATAC